MFKIRDETYAVWQIKIIIVRYRHNRAKVYALQHLNGATAHKDFLYCGRTLGTHKNVVDVLVNCDTAYGIHQVIGDAQTLERMKGIFVYCLQFADEPAYTLMSF